MTKSSESAYGIYNLDCVKWSWKYITHTGSSKHQQIIC